MAGKPSAADGSGGVEVETRSAVRAAHAPTIATVGAPQAMNEYRRRLNRTQIKSYGPSHRLLFIGQFVLPHIGQVIWTVILAAR